jgi:hypothetical protein
VVEEEVDMAHLMQVDQEELQEYQEDLVEVELV